jgi:hypothetical protein
MTAGIHRLIVLGLALVLLGAACSRESRPTVAEWRPQWEAVQAIIPSPDLLGDPPDTELCNTTHVVVRLEAPKLFPTPDPTIDDALTDWTEVARGMFFECPPDAPNMRGFDQAYAELERFAAEIDAVIALDLQGLGDLRGG